MSEAVGATDAPARRATGVPADDPIARNDAEWMTVFNDQYAAAWEDGAIPAKYKELIGVTLSVALRCEPCLRYHVGLALDHGALRDEIVEALRLGLVAGGSAGLPTMRAAYEVMDQR